MKLLLDNNLSYKLIQKFRSHQIECEHVSNLGFDETDDAAIWQYARNNDYQILTKDDDFVHFTHLWGQPPKVIWLKIGNSSTSQIYHTVIANLELINQAISEPVALIELEKLAEE